VCLRFALQLQALLFGLDRLIFALRLQQGHLRHADEVVLTMPRRRLFVSGMALEFDQAGW
jgi:hypothetical protein